MEAFPETDVFADAKKLIQGGQTEEATQMLLAHLTSFPGAVSAESIIEFSNLLWNHDSRAAVDLLEGAIHISGDSDAVHLLLHLMPLLQMHERRGRGLPMHHADRLVDIGMIYGTDKLERLYSAAKLVSAQHPDDFGASRMAGCAAFLSSKFAESEAAYQTAAKINPGRMDGAVRFNPIFYKSLDQIVPEQGLPPVIEIRQRELGGHALFFACDSNYFVRFTMPLLHSLQAKSPGCRVHVHIMMPDQAHIAPISTAIDSFGALDIRLTGEVVPPQMAANSNVACYYHGVRFIRFAKFVASAKEALWLMDVDAVVNRDVGPVFYKLAGNDIGLRLRPGRVEPWNQFSACLVTASASQRSRRYFQLVAAYLAHLLGSSGLAWGSDQMALYGVYRYLQQIGEAPTIACWGPDVADVVDFTPESFFWFTAGNKKISYAKDRNLIPQSETQARFWSLFHTYTS